MGEFYYFSIPVKKHIEKFIAATEGNVMIPGKQSFIWAIIRPYLIYKLHSGHYYEDFSRSYPGKIKMRIQQKLVRHYGLQPRINAVGLINKMLNMYFGKELSVFVHEFLNKEGRYRGYNAAITKFCEEYNIIIDEDISMDALQKLEFRHRKKNKKLVAEMSHRPN